MKRRGECFDFIPSEATDFFLPRFWDDTEEPFFLSSAWSHNRWDTDFHDSTKIGLGRRDEKKEVRR